MKKICLTDHPRRRLAIGDVHGCSKTLKKMLSDVLQLEPSDTLYLLGDYIDRGQDSKGVLDYLMQLLEAGYNIHPLMGNHEEMLLNAAVDPLARSLWYGNGGWGTMQEFGVDSPDATPKRYLNFLASLPLLHLLDDYMLVHAGLDLVRTILLRRALYKIYSGPGTTRSSLPNWAAGP